VFNDETIQFLQDVGLTFCQTKVYLTLVRSGISSVKEISKVSGVARQDIYRIIFSLQEIGLVHQVISNPNMHMAIPIRDALSILRENKNKKNSELMEKTVNFLQNYIPNQTKTKSQKETSIVVMLPKKEASIRKRREEIDNAQTSIEFITSWKRFPRTVHTFGERAKEALKRKVKMRVILEKPPKGEPLPEIIGDLKKMSNYKLRYILNPPSAIIGIFDKKRVIIKTSASVGLAEAPSLWSNNPSILSVFNDFFELTWITAIETIPLTLDANMQTQRLPFGSHDVKEP